MAGAHISGPRLKEPAQCEELIQEREDTAGKQEEALRKWEEEVRKREEAAATMQEKAVAGEEGVRQEKDKAMKKREGVLKKKEEELSKREQALKKPKKETKRIRASAAGSSSPPHQPPPPGPATHITQLPDDVLEMIFALLNLETIVSVLSVCRRWRGVVEDRNLIKELVLEGGKVTTQQALCLIHSTRKLKALKLSERSDTLALLHAASTRCTNLLHLSVHRYRGFSSSLIDILRKVFQTSPHITDLRLRCIKPSKNLRFYQELGPALPDLRKLEFDFACVWDPQLDALVDSCSRNQMEEFKVRSHLCSEETVAKLVQFWGRSLRVLELNASNLRDGALALLAGCSELGRLTLVGLPGRGDGLRGVAALSHLEELYLYHTDRPKPENWCRFFCESRSSHRLRKLFLLGRSSVDDRVLAAVAASCPQLEELEAKGRNVTISGVREVLQCCRKLQNLNVTNTDASVAHIVPELPQLAPQLCGIRIGARAKRRLGVATLRLVQAQMPHLRID